MGAMRACFTCKPTGIARRIQKSQKPKLDPCWWVTSIRLEGPNLTSSGTLAPNLVVGDFNNDGRDDVLYPDGASFRVKYSGTGNWVRLQYTGGTATFMLAGRFDATAATDILQTVR
jgi:hypothetical protein